MTKQRKIGMEGRDFSIDMWKCKTNHSENIKILKKIVNEIIKLINMKAISNFKVAKGKYEMSGYSLVKIIETSHVALHSFSINEAYMINVVSCKDFDAKKLKKYILDKFVPTGFNIRNKPIKIPVNVTR